MKSGWTLRPTESDRAREYIDRGYWSDDTFARTAMEGLARSGSSAVTIRSGVRPFSGSVADVGNAGLRVANALRGRGIGPGDVVAFQLPNWAETVSCYFGLLPLGVVLVPIVHIYGHRELGHILRQSRARVLITADRFGRQDFMANLEELGGQLPDLELVVVVNASGPIPTLPFPSRLWDQVVADNDPLTVPAVVDPDDPVIIGYTSGTTAEPKGVIHTHRTFLGEMRTFELFLAQDTSAVQRYATLSASPISHVTGLINTIRVLLSGGSLNLMDAWSSTEMLRAMETDHLALSGGATFFLVSILDDPLFSASHHLPFMSRLSLGGAPVPAEVVRRATELGISLVRAYGSTEHPSTTISLHSDPFDKRANTDGRPITGNEIRIVDEEGSFLGPGEPGEIISRGPDLFVGYTDSLLTDQAFDQRGWYHTGDIGHLDEDGYLVVTDRKKDIIIRGGENISAQEVEEVLLALPGIAELAVIAAPDPKYGEHGCAVVRMVPTVEKFDLQKMQNFLGGAGLARQKWPEELRFVSDFPRTATGKIQKNVLRASLRDGWPDDNG